MTKRERLAGMGGRAYSQDGMVIVNLPVESTKPGDDNTLTEMTPGQAPDLAAQLINTAKCCLQLQLGERR